MPARALMSRLLSVALVMAAAVPLVAPGVEPEPLLCVPPLVSSPARCTFNVYGTITDQHGAPVPGVLVSDGTPPDDISDAAGFYDVYEFQPGTVTLTFAHRTCEHGSDTVHVTPEAILHGGKRHDVQMLCSAE